MGLIITYWSDMVLCADRRPTATHGRLGISLGDNKIIIVIVWADKCRRWTSNLR